MEQVSLGIRNMVCRQCENTVAYGLARVRGIQAVQVDYGSSIVKISYDPGRCSPSQIRDALDDLGFPVGAGMTGRTLDILSCMMAASLFLLLTILPLPMAPMAQQGASLSRLFTLGLLTSTHCLAMCGGIMLSQVSPVPKASARRGCSCDDVHGARVAGIRRAARYNASRVASYVLVGALCGLVGSIIAPFRAVRGLVFTLAGAMVVVMGLRMMGIPLGRLGRGRRRFPRARVARRSERAFRRGISWAKGHGDLVVGLLSGLMPCGALMSLWMIAAASGSAFGGALDALSFALGTVPLMVAFTTAGYLLPSSWSHYLVRISSILIMTLGLSLTWRGIVLLPAVC